MGVGHCLMAQKMNIRSEDDIYFALSTVRHMMNELSFTELDQQKVFVSVSELTRNILDHAEGKGDFSCEMIKQGIRITVQDKGPGIAELDQVLSGKRPSESRGLGLGLSGVTRLMDEVKVETSVRGTKVVAVKWSERK